MIAIISFAQFKILGNDVNTKERSLRWNQHKETHHCLYSDFNDHFAPFDSLVHFPILLDFDRGL